MLGRSPISMLDCRAVTECCYIEQMSIECHLPDCSTALSGHSFETQMAESRSYQMSEEQQRKPGHAAGYASLNDHDTPSARCDGSSARLAQVLVTAYLNILLLGIPARFQGTLDNLGASQGTNDFEQTCQHFIEERSSPWMTPVVRSLQVVTMGVSMYILVTPSTGAVPLAFQILVLNVVYAITSAMYERTYARLSHSQPEKLHLWVQGLLHTKTDSPLSGSVLLAFPAVCIAWAAILLILVAITRLSPSVFPSMLSPSWICLMNFCIAVGVMAHAAVVVRKFLRLESDVSDGRV